MCPSKEYSIMKFIQNYRTFREIKSALEAQATEINFSTNSDAFIEDMDEQLVESYGISVPFPGKNSNVAKKDVCLMKIDNLFFSDFSVKINGEETGLSERRARKLYEMARMAKARRTKIEKVM